MAAALGKRGADGDLESPSTKQAKVSPAPIEKGCIHEIALPDGFQPSSGEKKPSDTQAKPAKEYPFTLDPFQREAIAALEAGESVMVSAHTSAGKTVIAEYAIAMALRDQQRVLYTSPIKALSNQKFRELAEEFSDVGLMTGDVTISSNASCLVMTTEILRSMQYRGSEVMREVAWIIFDEVHYMRDRERGVVWEESIVMAPKNARFVFLSATVPNAREFADWVAKVHQQPCHIVYTDFRPTPLQHYIFPAGGDGLYLVIDEQGSFREASFSKAVNAVTLAEPKKDGKWQKRKDDGKDEPSDIWKIVKMIIARQYDPVIVFSFSKRDCEFLAMQMSKMDLNSEDEKKLVEGIFRNAMDSLSEEDKKLPQVSLALPYLKRGIGVHHSGLLPILKEVIEILFQEGLIKCLFATETFSIGLNMPAKTVVFTNVRKFDGDKFRWITSGEYIQMSGRAGRRGLDNFGVCIFMLDEKLEPTVAKQIVKGTADQLNSAFHLGYNMILNQMRCEETNPEDLLRQSFHQFQSDRSLPTLEQRVKNLEAERDSIIIEDEEKLAEYYSSTNQLRKIKQQIREIVLAPRSCLPFLQPGRLVRIFRSADALEQQNSVLKEEEPAVWGVIINFEKAQSKDSDEDDPFESKPRKHLKYVVDVLVNCVTEKEGDRPKIARPVSLDENGQPLVTAFPLSQIESLSAVRVRIPRDLRPAEAREQTLRTVLEVLKRFPDGLQLLDPEDDMRVESSDYKKLVRRVEALETLIKKYPIAKSPTLGERLRLLQKKEDLAESIRIARKEVRAASALTFKDELKARRRVLRRLSYASREDVVELKGRVACEISSADELMVTELMFNGVFKDLTAEQAAALLSCLVWQEKTKTVRPLPEELAGLFSQLQDTARRVGKLQVECKVPVDVEEYVNSFRPDIMEGVYAWCLGKSFVEVLKVAEVFEGSLVRALRRLEELLQQLVTSSRAIGEEEMVAKFQDASTKMKRDIVFAASLYL